MNILFFRESPPITTTDGNGDYSGVVFVLGASPPITTTDANTGEGGVDYFFCQRI